MAVRAELFAVWHDARQLIGVLRSLGPLELGPPQCVSYVSVPITGEGKGAVTPTGAGAGAGPSAKQQQVRRQRQEQSGDVPAVFVFAPVVEGGGHSSTPVYALIAQAAAVASRATSAELSK